MTLTLKVTQMVGKIEASESVEIILDDFKHRPDLQILGEIERLKFSVVKKIDAALTELLNTPHP